MNLKTKYFIGGTALIASDEQYDTEAEAEAAAECPFSAASSNQGVVSAAPESIFIKQRRFISAIAPPEC